MFWGGQAPRSEVINRFWLVKIEATGLLRNYWDFRIAERAAQPSASFIGWEYRVVCPRRQADRAPRLPENGKPCHLNQVVRHLSEQRGVLRARHYQSLQNPYWGGTVCAVFRKRRPSCTQPLYVHFDSEYSV